MIKRTAAMLSAGSLAAAKTLLSLQDPSQPPAVRLGAARATLELGMKVREAVEFEERLAALEQDVAKMSGDRGAA